MQHICVLPRPLLDFPDLTLFVLAVFTATYAGMALGRFPGLRIDRTGIALVAVGLGQFRRQIAATAVCCGLR
jgi:hypothetical protein